MAINTKQTSERVAALAAQTLQSNSASKTAKSLAASALSQRNAAHQTGGAIEKLASTVLQSAKFAEATKELAGSVLSQANRAR